MLPTSKVMVMAGVFFALSGEHSGFAQSLFQQQINRHRQTYKAEFLKDPRSPLKQEDLPLLSFFDPDSTFRVEAVLQRTPEAEPFDLPTYDGQKKPYVQYAVLSFKWNGRDQKLVVYRSLQLARLPQYRDYLFLPFKDLTNGKETYGGGRYLDLRMSDQKEGKITIDFNKAYNPYCAYSDGYACPIPPKENHLPIAVRAGEKAFSRPH
ncbi:DUF1684 domain-containing protein [Larkinella soli]|uniref:DUF1684 domain-containing protein n=1 Tax=Larkinella soli TaxID=1770527 RepID=UPI001E2ECEED|nr:DUF1684 domain-containing protein [Larkinella soli]